MYVYIYHKSCIFMEHPMIISEKTGVCSIDFPAEPLQERVSSTHGFSFCDIGGWGICRFPQSHYCGVSTDLLESWEILPKCSMYGIFTYIYPKNGTNVGKYTIHRAYGLRKLKGNPPFWVNLLEIQHVGKSTMCCTSPGHHPRLWQFENSWHEPTRMGPDAIYQFTWEQ